MPLENCLSTIIAMELVAIFSLKLHTIRRIRIYFANIAIIGRKEGIVRTGKATVITHYRQNDLSGPQSLGICSCILNFMMIFWRMNLINVNQRNHT